MRHHQLLISVVHEPEASACRTPTAKNCKRTPNEFYFRIYNPPMYGLLASSTNAGRVNVNAGRVNDLRSRKLNGPFRRVGAGRRAVHVVHMSLFDRVVRVAKSYANALVSSVEVRMEQRRDRLTTTHSPLTTHHSLLTTRFSCPPSLP